MMVSIGLVALLLAMIEYRRNMRTLRIQFREIHWSPLPGAVALLISVLGLLALISIILRQ
jgi:hypothetical protein